MMRRSALSTAGLVLVLAGIYGCSSLESGSQASAPAQAPAPAPEAKAWWAALPADKDAKAAQAVETVFGPGSGAQWKVASGEYTVKPDAVMGKPAMTATKTVQVEGQTQLSGNRVITGWVNLGEKADKTSSIVVLRVGFKDVKTPGVVVNLTGVPSNQSVSVGVNYNNKPAHDLAEVSKTLDWTPEWTSSLGYKLKAYTQALPGWEEDFRVRVEHDMAQMPGLKDKWVQVRVETGKNSFRVWVDDRLVVTKTGLDASVEGTVQMTLYPGASVAGFTTGTRAMTPGFETVALGGYANAKAFLDGKPIDWTSLPAPGEPVEVGGVPFVFGGNNAEGNDHIDVGRSLFRQANAMGYLPTTGPRFGGADERDPARIQMRIPYGNYKALHLIAACDGEADSVPIITAQFYRPNAGFNKNFAAKVPLATAAGTDVKGLGTKLVDGRKVNLYQVTIPLDPALIASFSDLNVFEVELTKEVKIWRSYPDPISYGYHPAGQPSGVHVYAMTLQETAVDFAWAPDQFGHVWTAPAVPGYTATLTNRTGAVMKGKLTVSYKSYDGTDTGKKEIPVTLPAGATALAVKVPMPVKLNGYYDVVATLDMDGNDKAPASSWTESRSLARLAPDTRSAKWTPGQGTMFGYWSYHGGHHTPKGNLIVRLMTQAGARAALGHPNTATWPEADAALVKKHWSPTQAGAWEVAPQAWAADEPLDPVKVAEFQKKTIDAVKKIRENIPVEFRPDHIYFYAEPHISSRLSAGNVPDYWQEKDYELTEAEKRSIKIFYNTSKMAAEGFKKDPELSKLKLLIPWGDPGFSWPLLRAGFPKEYIDGSGIDIPGFERIPERQLHEQSIHRLYITKKEFEKAGIPKPQLQFCEGIFVPTEPGAVTYREQMDIYNRFSLISMAYGFDKFYSAWFAFDCGNYYGAEHYGGCGIQRRIPYCDPKPAYAAFATMTDKLNEANFQGWVSTGSLTNYALHFKGPKGSVYTLWNIRNRRPVTLTLSEDAMVSVTDAMNNTKSLGSRDKQVTVMTDPSVTYITFNKPGVTVTAVRVAGPDNSDAVQPADATVIANLGDGSWKYTNETDKLLETNHWAMMHYPGKFGSKLVNDSAKGPVLESTLLKQDKEHQLMPWYNTLKPIKPITIPGAPSHMGMWVKGNSDWGRYIYVLKDAKGELWYSIGEKDQYNCDDVHSWSQFNFDGWRYLNFEMPGHTGWDSYRKNGSTWWRFTQEGIVDLPLTLETVIVEQRTHILYVNDVQPVAGNSVQLGKIAVQYERPEDATEEAVKLSRLRMPLPTGLAALPNPIQGLEKEGLGAPTKLVKLAEPAHYYDGTRMHVHFEEAPGAVKYYVYCGPYADGRGAVNMVPGGIKNGQLVGGFRPGVPLFFWIVWEDKDKKLSKPSAVHAQTLVDNFKEK
jgi:hypothetical protein